MNQLAKTKGFGGRIYEAKDNFVIETKISEGHVSLQNPSDFIEKALAEFNGKEVEVEISIKISEKS
jgi:hypothetical protein